MNSNRGGFFMGVMDKIEDLVFQGGVTSSIELVRDRLIVAKMRCVIEYLSDDECHLLSASGTRYKILGHCLQIKEYGDTYVKVEGERITSLLIEEEAADE